MRLVAVTGTIRIRNAGDLDLNKGVYVWVTRVPVTAGRIIDLI